MKKRLKYQCPNLYAIGGSAHAACVSGSSASAYLYCTKGPGISNAECLNGSGADDYCSTGTAATYICSATGSEVRASCVNGTIP